jgi:hypothetical protein
MRAPRSWFGALAAMATAAALAAPAGDWPEVPLPPGAVSYSIGEQMSVSGMPMRVQGFDATTTPEQTAEWFRRHLPRPLMENRVGGKLVLGRAQGTHYITVQLDNGASGAGTRGVVAVSDVAAAQKQQAASRAASERVLAALPSGTQVVSALTSTDERRHASFMTLVNSYSEEVNRERVRQLLRNDGMELEREARAADAGAAALASLPPGAASGRMLFFKGRGKEAIAVISRMPDSRVSIVLNTVTNMETYQ